MKKNIFKQKKIIIMFLILLFACFELYLLLVKTNRPPINKDKEIARCSEYQRLGQKQQCWDTLINSVLEREGLSQAFNLFGTLYASDKYFASDCHDFSHTLGRKAYALFAKHNNIELTKMTSYCGYGFYHGFMEELIHKSGKLADAQKFCHEAKLKLQNETSDAMGACFHGIGHGFVEDIPDPSKWGNPEAIIEPGLAICEKIADSTSTLFRCTNGVFNALEILMEQNKYNLSVNHNDPFSVCKRQPEKYKKSCYTQMAAGVLIITKNNFEKALPYLNSIVVDEYAIPTFTSTNLQRVNLGMTDFRSTTLYCRSLPKRFYIPCIKSFAEGFLKYGPPENEYKKALSYCDFALLNTTEKKACFSHVSALLRIWYSKEKSLTICNSIDPQYLQEKCSDLY